jgi:hypothetical protein
VVVSNAAGQVTSSPVTVVPVDQPPKFTTDLPATLTVRAGATATFTVVADKGMYSWWAKSPTGENDYVGWPASGTYTTRALRLADDGMRVYAAATVPGPNHSCGGGANAQSSVTTIRVVP